MLEIGTLCPRSALFEQRTKGISWKLGSCHSTKNLGLRDEKWAYSKRCCLEPGEHILSCMSQVPHGWNGGYIEFLGNRYCDDFTGYIALRRVIINGMHKTLMFNFISIV